MSIEKCPRCGGYDVRPAYLNYIGRGIKKTGELAVALGVGLLMGGGHGAHAAHHIGESFDKKEKELKKHHCNTCGHEW